MALASGTRVGPYEIAEQIGIGGMGEVYRARDTTLGRNVAIKVLPDAFARDPDRLARFEREAKTLASLNHPNIATIHGLDTAAGVRALVMELVDGPTLADRIAQRPLPLDEALPIARQIADALDAAHAQGIIHRDLKPANIKLRPDGTVKVLDFGLAKVLESAASADVTQSPTITSPAMTMAGVILGTAAYMAPEQAKGREADKRSDLWAFGAVLYEMLTGTRAFAGEDVSDTVAFILTRQPALAKLPTATPPSIRRLLRRCFEKDRRRRLAAAADARTEIDDALVELSGAASPEEPAPRKTTWRTVAALVIAVIAGGAGTAAALWFVMRPPAVRVTRLTVNTPGETALNVNGFDRDLAISPDGSRIAYVGGTSSRPWIFLRALDQLEPIPLVQVGTPRGLFFSPDGRWVGFFDQDTSGMKKVAVTGGPVVTIPGPSSGAGPRGAVWLPGGTIVFATSGSSAGLQRVSDAGGVPTILTRPNHERGEVNHIWPESLPDGQSVLFTITTTGAGTANTQVAVLDLRTGSHKVLVQGGTSAHYVGSGHLVYATGGTLRAVRFDLNRLQIVGTEIPVVPQVLTTTIGAVDFDVARNGTLLYVPGGVQAVGRTLVWVDRQGHEEPIRNALPRAYTYLRISPDGTRVVLDIRDQENDLWLWDLRRETLERFTSDPTFDRWPVWMPKGDRVLFSSDRAGASSVFSQALDGSNKADHLTPTLSFTHFATGISPDGTHVVLQDQEHQDVIMVTLDKERRMQPLVAEPRFAERNGEISPNKGNWLAYDANDTGPFEIYVRPFPDVTRNVFKVSTGGGTRPAWSRTGEELFYLSPTGALMAVRVSAGDTWSAGPPVKLFEGPYLHGAINYGRTYDVSPDGRRFLMIKELPRTEASSLNLVVVQNWTEELKRLLPAD